MVGPNGAGKSTLLRILVGHEPSDDGIVRRFGTVGYLPQFADADDARMTVRQTILDRIGLTSASRELDRWAAALAAGDLDAVEPHAAALEHWLALGGADVDARLRAAVGEMGLAVAFLDRPLGVVRRPGSARGAGGAPSRALRRRAARRTHQPSRRRRTAATGGEHALERRAQLVAAERETRRRAAASRNRAHARVHDNDKHMREWVTMRADEMAGRARKMGTRARRVEVPDAPWENPPLRLALTAAERRRAWVVALEAVVLRRGDWSLGPLDVAVAHGDRVLVSGVMAADGFASLARDDAGMNVVFLRRGLPSLPADQRNDHVSGIILAFVIDDLECELARLQAEGIAITMPLTDEEWGERAFQVRDPNGVIVQLVDWNAPNGS